MTQLTNSTPDSEAARVMQDRQMLNYRTAIPGVVVAVSGDGTTVDVQPAVSMVQTLDGNSRGIDMPVVQKVPLAVLGSTGLGLFVAVPVRPGDDGLLIVCDRAIDSWQYGAGIGPPPIAPSPRHHDLTDAIFIPGVQRSSGAIAGYPTDAVEVRNRSGSIKASVSNTTIVLTSPVVTVNGSLNVTGAVTAASVAAPVVAAATSLTVAGKQMSLHRHDTSTNPSGAPI